jgi:hypothetical protein
MASTRRIRSILTLAAAGIGLAAAAPAPHTATLGVSLFCSSAGHGRLDCQAYADGGTTPYSFSWNPLPVAGGGSDGLALIPCTVGRSKTVTVTVTDANNDTATATGSWYCGDAQ